MYLSVAIRQLESAVPQQMQVTKTGAPLELKSAGKDAALQDTCTQAEAVQQSGEPIYAIFHKTKSVSFRTIDHQSFRLAIYISTHQARVALDLIRLPAGALPMLMPRRPVPELCVPTLTHGDYQLTSDTPQNFALVVFYRGLHCPICLKYLLELARLQPEFEKRGVKVITISSDTQERAQAFAEKLRSPELRIGYGLSLTAAREWGLYISTSRGQTSIGIEEPALFSEPGVFIVRPDGTLYYGAVQTMPFARPHFDELLAAIDFALAKNYPARGEYAGEL